MLRTNLTAVSDTVLHATWSNAAVTALLSASRVRLRVDRDTVRAIVLDLGAESIEFVRPNTPTTRRD